VVVKFDNVWVVQFVHDLNFKLDLFNQIVFNNFGFANDFNRVNVLRYFVSDFVHFSKATHADIAVS